MKHNYIIKHFDLLQDDDSAHSVCRHPAVRLHLVCCDHIIQEEESAWVFLSHGVPRSLKLPPRIYACWV